MQAKELDEQKVKEIGHALDITITGKKQDCHPAFEVRKL